MNRPTNRPPKRSPNQSRNPVNSFPVTEIAPRATFIVLEAPDDKDAGADVAAGLARRPRTLPARYFYDAKGSALFDRITELPEYYLTRAEIEILTQAAPLIAARTGPVEIVELGSGDDRKARLLLGAYAGIAPRVHYLPIDVSGAALKASAIRLADAIPGLAVTALQGTFDAALKALASPAQSPRMIMFLGSTLGNLDAGETALLLVAVHRAAGPQGFFLVGLDLRKDPPVIEAAYNDKAGVTAEFNRNMLRVLNRRFRADFVPERFAHHAFYNMLLHQIEMHLVSSAAQRVVLGALDLEVDIDAGESIRTEISRKFDLDAFASGARAQGFVEIARYTDRRKNFGLLLLQAEPA